MNITATPVRAKLVITLWLRQNEHHPRVMTSQLEMNGTTNRLSFTDAPDLFDVFKERVAREFDRLWRQLDRDQQVLSDSSYEFAFGDTRLRGVHVLQNLRANGITQIILRFRDVRGAVLSLFHPKRVIGLPHYQDVSRLALDTLETLLTPMLNLIANSEAARADPEKLAAALQRLERTEAELRYRFGQISGLAATPQLPDHNGNTSRHGPHPKENQIHARFETCSDPFAAPSPLPPHHDVIDGSRS